MEKDCFFYRIREIMEVLLFVLFYFEGCLSLYLIIPPGECENCQILPFFISLFCAFPYEEQLCVL